MKALGFAAAAAATLMAFAFAGPAQGQASASAAPAASAAARAAPPADPWPRVVDLSNGQALVYQPQVNKWDGNQLDFRAAVAIKPVGAKDESFGVIFATARTQVDKVARTVVFENLQVTKSDFPTLPNRGAALRRRAAEGSRRAGAHDLARPATGVAGRRRRQADDGAGQQHAAAGDRQLLAGDPGADRRRAGAEAGAGTRGCAARHQHPRADPAGRRRRHLLHPRLRRLAAVERDLRAVDAGASSVRS